MSKKLAAKEETVRYIKVDARNRVSLGQLAKGFSLYKMHSEGEKIILEPVKEIPAEEAWLFDPENKDLLESLKRGLKQKATKKRVLFPNTQNRRYK